MPEGPRPRPDGTQGPHADAAVGSGGESTCCGCMQQPVAAQRRWRAYSRARRLAECCLCLPVAAVQALLTVPAPTALEVLTALTAQNHPVAAQVITAVLLLVLQWQT